MLSRFRQVFPVLAALAIGYWLGGGPFARLVEDLVKMASVEWARYRVARTGAGTLPLLVAGFLLGQGIFLLVRRVLRGLGPARIQRAERVASWDPGLLLASRFGMQRYLLNCRKWAVQDPSARTQALVLFKIEGLGILNETHGTLAATRLLREIASELRMAALPDSASRCRQFLARHAPHPQTTKLGRAAEPRLAARWSGATLALAFRELQPHQVIVVAQSVGSWIEGELAAIDKESLGLSIGIGVGSPTGSARALERAAATALAGAARNKLVVAHDRSDMRAGILGQIPHVEHIEVSMAPDDVERELPQSVETSWRERCLLWVKDWGPALGCLAVVPTFLWLDAPKRPIGIVSYPWPEQVRQIPLVDRAGTINVKLIRSTLSDGTAPGWELTEGMLVQPDSGTQMFRTCQVHVAIRNSSAAARYVSAADFALLDASGWEGTVDTARQLRLAEGITGKWLSGGETWSGWFMRDRSEGMTTGIVFQPDSSTRVAMRAGSPR